MKKSKILTVVGILIIVTVLLSTIGKPQIYEKKMNFSSTDELLTELNSKPLAAYKDENRNLYNIVYSDAFNECLSKRKRITCPSIKYSRLNLKVNMNNNDKEHKEKIINKYISLGKNINSFGVPDKIEAYNLIGTYENLNRNMVDKIDMDVVMIDEGEGWVIDYFMVNVQGDGNDTGQQ